MKIAISSGHGKHIRGASGYLDEVDEARRVVETVAEYLRRSGVEVTTFHDDVSRDQSENLHRIVDWHNSQARDLDVSVHFNAYETTDEPMGTEVLFVTEETLAKNLSMALAAALSLPDRGAKRRDDLFFLNNTAAPAVLIETCFVDSSADADSYGEHYGQACAAIARTLRRGDVRPYPPPLPALDPGLVAAIRAVAMDSAVATYPWEDRGIAPPGYVQGMALAYAIVLMKFLVGDPAALEMAKANTWDSETDVMSWYADEFHGLGWGDHNTAGTDILRHLFVVLLGLGMRESSGQHCCGRDMSADNVSSDTAEAGSHQTSWNINTCSDVVQGIMDQYKAGGPLCMLEVWSEGVECDASEWECYGSGDGYLHQELSKSCPQYHVEVTAVGLRNRRQHWGPINRREVELLEEADEMFAAVQRLVTAAPAGGGEPDSAEAVEAVLRLVKSMTDNGDTQLAILTVALVTACRSFGVDRETTMTCVREALDEQPRPPRKN